MKSIKSSLVALVGLFAFFACQTEKDRMAVHHFGNKLYINTSSASEEILVKLGMSDVVRTLSVGVPMPAEQELGGVLVADHAFVENYRKIYGVADAQPLPYENCIIENPEVTIKAGTTSSAPATIIFTGLSDLDRTVTYVMPVVLKNVTDINVIGTKREVYYVFKGAALINVVCNMTDNRAGAKAWATPEKFENMKTFTLEALVRQNELKTGKIIHSIMGVEGHFLLRLGDAGLDPKQLQVATGANITSSEMMTTLGKWTHMAVVFDNGRVTVYYNGVQVGAGNASNSAVNFKAYGEDPGEVNGRYFWLGYSYTGDRDLMGELSEVRIWDHCLSAAELNETGHFYTVDPMSEGLIAYWKMDEGAGRTLKDSSPNGNHMELDKDPRWVKVTLPED